MNEEQTIAEQNVSALERKPREPKKEHFNDGDYVVPGAYKCTKCGKTYHVARQTAINRINKQYHGNIKEWLENAKCSSCKAEEKLELKIQELQAKKVAKEQATAEAPKVTA